MDMAEKSRVGMAVVPYLLVPAPMVQLFRLARREAVWQAIAIYPGGTCIQNALRRGSVRWQRAFHIARAAAAYTGGRRYNVLQ